MMLLATITGFGLMALVEARSDGVVGMCDAHGNAGCAEWYSGYGVSREWKEDRLQCLDADPGIMYWAKRPDRSDHYELRVEDGATTYSPDELVTLVLEVKSPGIEYKYRGVLLHAVNEAGTTVGSFEFPDEGEQLFHSPHTCPQAALHKTADLKPYSTRFHWRAPSDLLDEKVTFRCLLKRGPANHGYFHYPNGAAGDLTIDPAPSDGTESLFVGIAGNSCNQACAAEGLVCDPNGMKQMGSAKDLEADLGDSYACPLPLVKGCANPTASASKCTFSSDTSKASCTYRRPGVQLICSCMAAGRRLEVETDEQFPAMHNGLRTSFPAMGIFMSVASAFLVAESPLVGLGFGLLALSQLPGVQAHNWLLSDSRAANQASTNQPCRGRKTTDTHAQVSAGQTVNMLWSTGHVSTKNYLVVLPGSEFHQLHADDLTKIFDEYIDGAPANSNFANDPLFRRQHGDRRDGPTCEEILTEGGNDLEYYDFFTKVIAEGDSDFITHPSVADVQRCLWEYKDDLLTEDVHVAYESSTYPWIESVAMFRNLGHWPQDFDAARVPMNGRHGPGHYVIYWHWRGYSDCVDVNFFDFPVPQDLIYGESTGNFYMNRVDHCQYQQPAAILSECHEVIDGNIDVCADELFKWMPPNNGEGFTFGKRPTVRDNGYRVGINVVPAMKPPAVPEWMGTGGIPTGNNPVCGRSDWLDLTGKGTISTSYTTQTIQWNRKFVPLRTVTEQARCAEESRLWIKEGITLLDAVALCARDDCKGIAWFHGRDGINHEDYNPGPEYSLTDMYTGLHTFEGCSDEPVEVELTEACHDRPSVADPNEIFRDVEGYTCDDLRGEVITSNGEMWKWCHNAGQTARRFPRRQVDGLCMGHACCGCGFSDDDRGGIFSYYSSWTYFGKNFEEDLTGASQSNPEDLVPIANINFQNYYSLLSDDESLIFPRFDIGMAFQEHGTGMDALSYGWVCPGRDEGLQIAPEIKDLVNPNGPRLRNPVIEETTADQTVARKLDYSYCQDEHHHAYWELQVPAAGVYTVEMMVGDPEGNPENSQLAGCSIEGDQVTLDKTGRGIFSRDVEVLDGNLTFSSQSNPKNFRCDGISWIKIWKKPEIRLPTPTWLQNVDAVRKNPWWQMELAESTAIGAVTIDTMTTDQTDCTTRWLFKGTSCTGAPILGDFYDEDQDGALVGVSDTPCRDQQMCPGTVCGRIDRAVVTCHGSLDCQLANTKYQTTIDCKGAKGKYVWVQLPGRRRVLAGLEVEVNRYVPEITASGNPVTPDTLLCYGVQARTQTEVEPEYETTNDPTDPMFYSTCYVREKEVKWLGESETEPETRWRFNGHCVECADVSENALMKAAPPLWRIAEADQCEDCEALGELCTP